MSDSFILVDPNKMKSLLVSVVRTLTVMSKNLFLPRLFVCASVSLTRHGILQMQEFGHIHTKSNQILPIAEEFFPPQADVTVTGY